MQFGVCGDPGLAASAARASYDFMEWSVGALLKPREPETAFHTALKAARDVGMDYPVTNCFIPGDLKITGPDAGLAALKTYVATTMERAEQAGVQVIVFGSGGARRIPDGFAPSAAHEQLVAFCQMIAPLADKHGVTIVVEPLNKADCNVLTTVSECALLVNETDHASVRLLVDAYHFMRDGDSYEALEKYGHLLAHVHIATVPNRLAPGAEPCDFSRFFQVLAKVKYTGRISIEGKIPNPETELPTALALMTEYARTQ